MLLNQIQENPGASKSKIRVGRGAGSGLGKTCGRGVKGQKSRSGVAIKGFEGGQMPLYRRLPKRGFKKWRRREFNVLNISDLQSAIVAKHIDVSKPFGVTLLVTSGVLKRYRDGLRILGEGVLEFPIHITADYVSPKAHAAINKAGGSVTLIEKRSLPADEKKRAKTAEKKGRLLR
ncbi:MAG: 50S ribosomal protein L15 [Hyphomicrobiaceae bacterium]|nr:50S ribosomal protein L15 [Hyphomicrobiaceae bacterium]